MTEQVKTYKEQQARDIALILTGAKETDVTDEDVHEWSFWDVYEWLEAWGYYWDEDDQEWVYDDESEAGDD